MCYLLDEDKDTAGREAIAVVEFGQRFSSRPVNLNWSSKMRDCGSCEKQRSTTARDGAHTSAALSSCSPCASPALRKTNNPLSNTSVFEWMLVLFTCVFAYSMAGKPIKCFKPRFLISTSFLLQLCLLTYSHKDGAPLRGGKVKIK